MGCFCKEKARHFILLFLLPDVILDFLQKTLSWRFWEDTLQHGRHHDSLFRLLHPLADVCPPRVNVWQNFAVVCLNFLFLLFAPYLLYGSSWYNFATSNSYFIATYSTYAIGLFLTSAFYSMRLRWLKAGLLGVLLPLLLRQRLLRRPCHPRQTRVRHLHGADGRESVAHPEDPGRERDGHQRRVPRLPRVHGVACAEPTPDKEVRRAGRHVQRTPGGVLHSGRRKLHGTGGKNSSPATAPCMSSCRSIPSTGKPCALRRSMPNMDTNTSASSKTTH